MPEKFPTLQEYSSLIGRSYRTVWRYYKEGAIVCRKNVRGRIFVVRGVLPKKRGRPFSYNRKKILKRVYQLCKNKYVPTSKFPSALYKLCRSPQYGIGSVRAAKWQAKLLFEKRWTYPQFIRQVTKFCRREYRLEKDWPYYLKEMAHHFCGSVRQAKWEAGIIQDQRRHHRKKSILTLWPKEKFLNWVQKFCAGKYKKSTHWPGYMRYLAVLYCHSVRGAKWQAKILSNRRKGKR